MTKELELTAPIGVFLNKGNQNYSPSWRLFITVEDLHAVPDDLFAVKVSQSQNPELSGKVVFKYFSFKVNDDAPWSIHAPNNASLTTPPSELKAEVIQKLGHMEDAEKSLAINLPGNFSNILTGDGELYTVFDKKEFPQTDGNPGYYIKQGSVATVKLTEATHLGNKYYQVRLSTDLTPDELFVKAGRSKVWGQDGGSAAPAGYADGEEDAATDEGSPW